MRLAAELARERGRIVVVGDVPVEADRALKSGATGDVVLPALMMAITGERVPAERT